MRILLVSDVHLDAPFAWAKPEIARRRRQALRDALARSIRLAADEHVDLICCGGDLFEQTGYRQTPVSFCGLFSKAYTQLRFTSLLVTTTGWDLRAATNM